MPRSVPALCVAALVVLSGCAAFTGPGTDAPDATTTAPPTTTATGTDGSAAATTDGTPTNGSTTEIADPPDAPPDPESDVLGWENGLWYNESIDVDQSDGLTRTELETVKFRQMARLERIRGLEYEDAIAFEVITHEEFEDRDVFSFRPDPWRDGYWEAAFVVGEDTDTADSFAELYGAVVDGYQVADRVVLVRDEADPVRIDPSTLAHELAHALDRQALAWNFGAGSRDRTLANRGVVEGSANYLEARYLARCGEEWSCLDAPDRNATTTTPAINEGLYVWFSTPYTLGPGFVASVRERGGWAAVDRLFAEPPEGTEQVIHPSKYPGEEPVEVTVADRSSADWRRMSRPGGRREAGTMGEASLYATFWHNGVVPKPEAAFNVGQRTGLNYTSTPTAGWGGDAFVPYTNGSAGGYVFESAWDTERDAREFHDAYLDLLASEGATEVRDGVYRIPESSPFGDAFRVVRRGETVLVVNAPTVEQLDDVHRPAD